MKPGVCSNLVRAVASPGLALDEPLPIQLCQHIHLMETLSWLMLWVGFFFLFLLFFFGFFFPN